ncbi:MAG TPA: DUF3105 domain-containing protein [Candidatus Bathyarchaeia archaeon]|nr:DUF3105 domain-containing protein [Candidatus Bathyarchaeia archaeon]
METRGRPEGRIEAPPHRTRGWLPIAIAGAVVAAAVAGGVTYYTASSPPGTVLPDQGNLHVQTLKEPIPPYNSDPPTSGPHLPYIAPWGIHTEPVPRQLQVHNLEDGGVMVQYNCPEPCPDLVAKLAAIVSGYDEQVILAPYPGMKTRIALTAWTRLDAFNDFDEKRIRRFISAYRGIDHHPR